MRAYQAPAPARCGAGRAEGSGAGGFGGDPGGSWNLNMEKRFHWAEERPAEALFLVGGKYGTCGIMA